VLTDSCATVGDCLDTSNTAARLTTHRHVDRINRPAALVWQHR
jgi:hypothetical protein